MSDESDVSAEAAADGLGCPGCRRKVRGTGGRALVLCVTCRVGVLPEVHVYRPLRERGWHEAHVSVVRYVTGTSVPWLAVQTDGERAAAARYFVPVWVSSLFALGSAMRKARLTLGSERPATSKPSKVKRRTTRTWAVADWRLVVVLCADNRPLRRSLSSLYDLGATPPAVLDHLRGEAPQVIVQAAAT
jgi:hypothetical protein